MKISHYYLFIILIFLYQLHKHFSSNRRFSVYLLALILTCNLVFLISPYLLYTGNYNFLEFISNSKSGQFFFYSHDGKYMIKTQTKEENKFMKRVLPHYYKFVTENPHTLLVRILGKFVIDDCCQRNCYLYLYSFIIFMFLY